MLQHFPCVLFHVVELRNLLHLLLPLRFCNATCCSITLLQLQHDAHCHHAADKAWVSFCADDEDEYIGSLNLCSIDDEETCDVAAVDRFHGLRVAHPVEAHGLGQGVTVGRDTSCDLVLDDPTVRGCHALPVPQCSVCLMSLLCICTPKQR